MCAFTRHLVDEVGKQLRNVCIRLKHRLFPQQCLLIDSVQSWINIQTRQLKPLCSMSMCHLETAFIGSPCVTSFSAALSNDRNKIHFSTECYSYEVHSLITLKRDCVYSNNHDVFVQFGTNKTCKVFKNQLNCTNPEVLNLSVFNFFKCYEKKFVATY